MVRGFAWKGVTGSFERGPGSSIKTTGKGGHFHRIFVGTGHIPHEHRIERGAGTLAALIAIFGILLATILDPSFRWTVDALSDLGVRAGSALVFNGALILAGALGIIYAVGLLGTASTRRRLVIASSFGLASLSLAGVGLFVIGHPWHAPAAIGFYLLATVSMLLDGVDRRAQLTGRITLALAVTQILVWSTWGLSLWPGSGLALPEFAGAVIVVLWILATGPLPTIVPLIDQGGSDDESQWN